MPSLRRRFQLAVLLGILLSALPAARPALALTFTVNDTGDADDGLANSCGSTCTLREAIRLANSNTGADTITFSFAGAGPHSITPATPLPPLSDNGTTVDGTNATTGAAHQVVLSGTILSTGPGGHGLLLRGNNIEIRSLVIGGFGGPVGDPEFVNGSGIFIDGTMGGGDNNRIYNNRIGVTADGASAFRNSRYGVRIGGGASNNIVGGTGPNQRNVIASGGVANVGVGGAGETVTNSGNIIAGNYIGTNAAGTGRPTNVSTDGTQAGINIDTLASGTVIADNLIGGMIPSGAPNPVIAGITVNAVDASVGANGLSAKAPTGTVMVRNLIGVTSAGVAVPNRVGISIGGESAYGPYDTTIGDPANPAGGRNIIAGNTVRGIEITETSFKFGDVTIAGNYIGLDSSGAPQPNGTYLAADGGEGIRVGIYNPAQPGPNPRVTVGPGNVISANITFGVRLRSGGHVVRGNYLGTSLAADSSQLHVFSPSFSPRTANGAASIWVENGDGVTIGGDSPADRNIIAFSASISGRVGAAVLIDPDASESNRNCNNGPCSTAGNIIRNNYVGVTLNGAAALNSDPSQQSQREGIRLFRTSGNTVSDNVISGTGIGIAMGGTINSVAYPASNNTISDNKIGTRASGITTNLLVGIGNREEGIRLLSGTGNTITRNLVAYSGADSNNVTLYHGILVGTAGASANNNTFSSNRLVRNGGGTTGDGIRVDTADGIRITRTETSLNDGTGIRLVNGGNNEIGAPTISAVSSATPPVATGTLPAACDGCTVEIFASATSEVGEGPTFIASGTAAGTGFSIPVPGCLRYLTATVTDAGGNTSPFSAVLDSGAVGPCVPALTLTLDQATPNALSVSPGASATYTHRLTHNAQVERTYTIQITSTLGWASAPTFVTLPAAAAGSTTSADFNVVVSVPAGTATNTVDTTTVRAFFSATLSSATRTNTTTAQVAAQNPAAPAVSPGQTKPFTPNLVTFTHKVTNTGDLQGTFQVLNLQVVGAPPGFNATWSLAKTLLNGKESTDLTISVTTPAAAPAPGNITVRFAVGVVGGPQTSDVDDIITVAAVRSFTFTPAEPQAKSTPSGSDVSFDYVLTNTGNAADSFSVTGAVTGSPNPLTVVGVSASPSLTNLPAGGSSNVRVTFRVPQGTLASPPSYGISVTAQGTGGASPPAAVVRTGTVTVTGGGAAIIQPGVGTPNPVNVIAATRSVTFTNTVTNTGNAAVPITVPASFTSGVPAGWTATTLETTCDDSATIAAGAVCTFTVVVTVPQGADAGSYSIPVTATAVNSGQPGPPADVTATANNVVNVLLVRGVVIAPDRAASGLPGELVTFTHTLTNTGNGADSFTLGVTTATPGWTTLVTPTSALNVPRGATRPVTVTVRIPAAVSADATNTFTVTATAQGGAESDTAVDTITVATITAADLSPGGRQNLDAGETVTYTHTLTNTGTTLKAFSVENSDSAPGWSSTVDVSPVAPLAPGGTALVTVTVTAPLAATAGQTNTTTLRVFESGTGTPVLDQEQDVTAVGPAFGALLAPDNTGVGFPNSTAVFTHTLTNIGSAQGLFSLAVAEASGWPATVTPSLVNLGAGVSVEVQVRVIIPGGVRADVPGAPSGFARVTAQLVSDATVKDDATNTITVGRISGVDLSSSQVRLVESGGPPQSLSNLAVNNRGNSFDSFDLTATDVPAGWSVRLTPQTVQADKDSTVRVNVEVTVPAGVEPRTIRIITVEARSRTDPMARDSVQLTLVYNPAVSNPTEVYFVHLPLVRR